jgi:hypothetical protein
MLRFFFAPALAVAILCAASPAFADQVAVLPFTAPKGLSKPEVDRARVWTREATIKKGHVPPNDSEMLSAEMAVKDGMPDTSEEYRAAGRASGSQWTLTGRIERHDAPPARLPDGTEEEGYTTYHLEVEACLVESGRVESLAREIDPDEAPEQIGEMLGLLLRPEGIKNAQLPWDSSAPHKRQPKPKAPPPPPPAPPPPPPPPKPVVKHTYAENRPAALGISAGVSTALKRPANAQGPSGAFPIGAVLGYAIEQVPGVEVRGIFTSQVLGPRALEIAAGGRYAIRLLPQHRIFVGPELLLGAHVALGADKTARFLTHGAAFVAIGLGEQVQLEVAGDLAAALGGSGTLILGGGTGRALFRF